ncbi:nuclear migration and anchoring protein unc-84 [Ditylenchus destructor]|uniref:Nuclear migration and anchoring protein unc-84 n=1 Tax=Ditylenchus destructor TaxID=166010 RepID=A0AAD4MHG0_9BILA|nr:nuclear migration and anchoring protein unc-84 [Ditylenchus destructor]
MTPALDSVRKRLSFSRPSPTPSVGSNTPRLTQQEIDEILTSPYETGYTYSNSAAYKRIGSTEFRHPQLCRRLRLTPPEYSDSASSRSDFYTYENLAAPGFYRKTANLIDKGVYAIAHLVKVFIVYIATCLVFVVTKTISAIRDSILWLVKYLIIAPHWEFITVAASSISSGLRSLVIYLWQRYIQIVTTTTIEHTEAVRDEDDTEDVTREEVRLVNRRPPPIARGYKPPSYGPSPSYMSTYVSTPLKSIFWKLIWALTLGFVGANKGHEHVDHGHPSAIRSPILTRSHALRAQKLRAPSPAPHKHVHFEESTIVSELPPKTRLNISRIFIDFLSLLFLPLTWLLTGLSWIFSKILGILSKSGKETYSGSAYVLKTICFGVAWILEAIYSGAAETLGAGYSGSAWILKSGYSTSAKALNAGAHQTPQALKSIFSVPVWILQTIYSGAAETLNAGYSGLVHALNALYSGFTWTLRQIYDFFGLLASSIIKLVLSVAKGIYRGIYSAISSGIWSLKAIGSGVSKGLYLTGTGIGNGVYNVGKAIWKGVSFVGNLIGCGIYLVWYAVYTGVEWVVSGLPKAIYYFLTSSDKTAGIRTSIQRYRTRSGQFVKKQSRKAYRVVTRKSTKRGLMWLLLGLLLLLPLWFLMNSGKLNDVYEQAQKTYNDQWTVISEKVAAVTDIISAITEKDQSQSISPPDQSDAIAALQSQIDQLKKQLRELSLTQSQTPQTVEVVKQVTSSAEDISGLDAKIAAILNQLMSSEREAILLKMGEVESRVLKKAKADAQELNAQNPPQQVVLNPLVTRDEDEERAKMQQMEKEVDKKIATFMSSISNSMNEQNSKLFSELRLLREKYSTLLKEKSSTSEKTTVILERETELDEDLYLSKVRTLIKEYIQKYDADKTGLPDYALESSGGSVASIRCTVPYNERSRTQMIFGIPLWYSSYSPRSVIQRKGHGASAGECWAFLSPDGHIQTAPKDFLVYSYQDVDDLDSRFLLGNFTYDDKGEPLQMFQTQHHDPRFTPVLELETLSNYGAMVTCLYRFRVHGVPAIQYQENP